MLTLEREVAEEHLVHKHANCPDIHFVAVHALPENLWGHVGSGAAEGVDIIIIFPAKAQIAYLGHIPIIFPRSVAEQ